MKKTKGQQEILGFVLIVVLVVIALLVFLVLSLRQPAETNDQSRAASDMLNAMMGYTTDCALVFEPQYDTLEDLFKHCFEDENNRCSNKEVSVCSYLNETLFTVLLGLMKSEATIQSLRVSFLQRDDAGEVGASLEVPEIIVGNCTGSKHLQAAQRTMISDNTKLVVRLEICKAR